MRCPKSHVAVPPERLKAPAILFVLVPAGPYTAYRFDVELFAQVGDSAPVANATEYYVPSTGLVKMTLQGNGLNRTIARLTPQKIPVL